MKISKVWDVRQFFRSNFEPFDLSIFGNQVTKEDIELNKRRESLKQFINEVPDGLVTISFQSENERLGFVNKFQKNEIVEGFIGLYVSLLNSQTLIGYYGDTEIGFFVHIVPDLAKEK